MTCSRPQRNVHRWGIEPGTPRSEIRRPIHCATPPLLLPTLSKKTDWKENPSKVKLLSWKTFPSKKTYFWLGRFSFQCLTDNSQKPLNGLRYVRYVLNHINMINQRLCENVMSFSSIKGPPWVLGIWGEGLFIFRELGSSANYFRRAGEQAHTLGDLGSTAKKLNKINSRLPFYLIL